MASITPLSALPANGVTPSGTLTLSNLQGRLTARLTNGGSAQLYLITMTEGGNWAYVTDSNGALVGINLSSQQNLGDGVGVLTFDNAAVSTKYHCVLNGGSSPVSVWLSALTDPGTSTDLVAHASTHLAGGSDDLLGAPGTVGGTTPGVFIGTFGPSSGNQNTVPSINGDTFALVAASQTLTNKTLTTPVINGASAASGNLDFSGSTGTFKTSTGAVTIGGGSAAISATSSAAAITLTAGAASTWSTTTGALNVDGFAGINLKINGTTVADVGATNAAKLTLAANKSLSAAAGSTGLDLGNATGDSNLPTGSLAWAAAAGKTLSLAANGAASLTSVSSSLTLTAAAASTWSTSSGALAIAGAAGVNLRRGASVLVDVGATAATAVTLAANTSLVGAAGTGAVTLGSMTGDMSLPTGALSWAGAANKNLSLVASGTGTVTINSADVMNIGTSGTTTLTLGRADQTTIIGGFTKFMGAYYADTNAFEIEDPGNDGQIDVSTAGVCNLTSTTGETRSIAIPTFVGQEITINCAVYGGDIVVTSSQPINQAGNTVMTFGAVRDCITLKGIKVGTALRWVVTANDGVALS